MIQIKGGFDQSLVFAVQPEFLLPSIDRQFARDARDRIQQKASGSEGSRYLTLRSGDTAKNAFGYATPTGAVIGASGPGVQLQEEGSDGLPGGVVTPKTSKYLTFRLFQPGDTTEATGRWVRLRSVKIRATHFIRDSIDETLTDLPLYVAHALKENGW